MAVDAPWARTVSQEKCSDLMGLLAASVSGDTGLGESGNEH